MWVYNGRRQWICKYSNLYHTSQVFWRNNLCLYQCFTTAFPFLSTNHSIVRMNDRICLYLYCFVYMYKSLIHFGIYHYFIDLQLAQIVRYVLNLVSYFTRFNGFITSHHFSLCYSIPCFFLYHYLQALR